MPSKSPSDFPTALFPSHTPTIVLSSKSPSDFPTALPSLLPSLTPYPSNIPTPFVSGPAPPKTYHTSLYFIIVGGIAFVMIVLLCFVFNRKGNNSEINNINDEPNPYTPLKTAIPVQDMKITATMT